ncbi:MAG: hypothetical protein HC905_09915 [Bacteroidales bacterium]|nr:hypothetical protein [Bacteroidales bacterium]
MIKPILTGLYRLDKHNPAMHLAGGVNVFASLAGKLKINAGYSLHYLSADSSFFNEYSLPGRVIPHYRRYASKNGSNYLLHDINFAIKYHPFKYIDIEAGVGKHHIGDGYRSVFLSTNAASYPYLKTSLHFWKIHYFSMVTSMRDYLIPKGYEGSFKKYVSLHYLSWNITPRINLNLFEAVIWDRADTLSKRSLDINYLNPVIFTARWNIILDRPIMLLWESEQKYLLKKPYHSMVSFCWMNLISNT